MESKFKTGDRVIYAEAGRRSDWRGKVATITNVSSARYGGPFYSVYSVRFDEPWASNSYEGTDIPESSLLPLARITEPTQEAIDAALAVLKEAGEVTFKPHRPPFKAKRIRLNAKYFAGVTEKGVQVGCQVFPLAAVIEVGEAAREALNYADDALLDELNKP